ncbi:MAG: type IV secretory system conjugative DNA transfer family protein [Rhodospirillales bacterium]
MIATRRTIEIMVALGAAAVTGLAIATQYVAWRLGYQPALGAPLAVLGMIPLYPPWRIVTWWLAWRHAVPVIGTGLIIAGAVIAAPVVAGLVRLVLTPRQAAFGKTAWGAKRDGARAGLRGRTPAGTVLGRWPDGRLITYMGDEHQLVAGAAGSGKTTGPVISTLLAWPSSVLVYDPKRELYAQTAHFRSRLGEAFYIDPTCEHSARFNPLWEIRTGTVHETGDVQNVVSILIDPGGAKNSYDYWESDAAKMLTGLILHALHALPRGRQHLAAINDMLLSIRDSLQVMAQSTQPRVRAIAEYLLSLPDRQFGGVHGSASAALILYDDPVVARNTSCSDFRISDLVCASYPMTCYLQVRPTDAVRLRPLTRLILTQVAQALMYDTGAAADGRAKKHRLLYLLEEFPSLGRLDFFSSQMRVMRGYGITALLIVQSFKDIINAYGRDQTIVDNCRIVVCFAAADPDTQKMISTMLGSAVEKKQSETRPHGWAWFKGSTSTSEARRPLLDAGEVRQVGYDEQLVLVTGEKPFRTKKVQWFRHRRLRRLGTNLRRGGIAPGQNPEILAMAARQPEQPAAAMPHDGPAGAPTPEPATQATTAAADSTQPSAGPALGDLVRQIGWEKSEAARRLFPDANFNSVRTWIIGVRAMPAAHEPFVARLAAWVDAFQGNPEEMQTQLTPERIDDLRREASGGAP